MGLASERRGEGDPRLVLVHGFTQTGRSWATVAAALGTGREVVTVDLPGHGGSAGVTADLRAAGTLLGEAGGRGVYVGYSLGGRVLLHLLLDRPDLVQGAVLLGATAGLASADDRVQRRADDEALARRIERGGVDAFLAEWLAQPLFAGLAPDERDLDDRRRNTAAGLAGSLRTMGTGTQEPLDDRLRALRPAPPVLVLAGEHDAKFRAEAERLAGALGPSARSATVAGAGHAAHLEQPERFVALVEGWLRDDR